MVNINLVAWASDISDIFMEKLAEETGKTYTVEDEEGISFTEEGQDIFNSLYDKVRDFLDTELQVEEPNYELKVQKI